MMVVASMDHSVRACLPNDYGSPAVAAHAESTPARRALRDRRRVQPLARPPQGTVRDKGNRRVWPAASG